MKTTHGNHVLMHRVVPVLISLLLVAGFGCRSIGPRTIPRDRYDYSGSISESWKRQTLLNIVKLRYLDPPSSSTWVRSWPAIRWKLPAASVGSSLPPEPSRETA